MKGIAHIISLISLKDKSFGTLKAESRILGPGTKKRNNPMKKPYSFSIRR